MSLKQLLTPANVIMFFVTIIFIGANYWISGKFGHTTEGFSKPSGEASVLLGFDKGWTMFYRMAPQLMFIFIISGQIEALTMNFENILQSWMSGNKGLFGSTIAGFMTPSVLVSMKLVAKTWKDTSTHVTLFLYILISQNMNWNFFLIRMPFLDWNWGIGLRLYVANAIMSLFCTGIFMLFAKYLARIL